MPRDWFQRRVLGFQNQCPSRGHGLPTMTCLRSSKVPDMATTSVSPNCGPFPSSPVISACWQRPLALTRQIQNHAAPQVGAVWDPQLPHKRVLCLGFVSLVTRLGVCPSTPTAHCGKSQLPTRSSETPASSDGLCHRPGLLTLLTDPRGCRCGQQCLCHRLRSRCCERASSSAACSPQSPCAR